MRRRKIGQDDTFLLHVVQEDEPSRVRAAGYIRVSTTAQAEEGLGLQVQREAIQRYAVANQIDLTAVYEDAGVSGSNGMAEREGFGLLSVALEARDFDTVIVLRLDRLARDLMIQESIYHYLKQRGARLISIQEPNIGDDDPARTAFRQMMGVMAQLSKDMIVARLRAGRLAKSEKEAGYAGGWLPYGYTVEGSRHEAKIVVHREQAPIVRSIFEASAQGLTTRLIADRLQARRVPTRRGGRWASGTISRILNNPHYKGEDLEGNRVGIPALVDRSLWAAANPSYRLPEERITSTSRGQASMSVAE